MIKRYFLLIIFSVATYFSFAQALENVKENIYYEKWESAKKILNMLLSAGSAPADHYYYLGEIYLEQGKPDSAKYFIEKGMALFPDKKDNPLIYIGKAHLLLNEKKTSEANQLIEEVLEATKYKNTDAILAAAKALVNSEQGDAKTALALLEKMPKKAKKQPEMYAVMGDAYRKLVDGSNAVISYQKAVEADAGFAEGWYKLGKVFKTQNNTEVFLDRFTKAVSADEKYVPVLYELFNYYFYRGDVANAQLYLDKHKMYADPSLKLAYMTMDLLYLSGKYKEAIADAQAILEEEKDRAQPRLYKLIAYSYEESGDSVKAFDYAKKYFDRQDTGKFVPKDYELYGRLMDRVANDKLSAAAYYEKAYTLETLQDNREVYAKKIAGLYKEAGDRASEGKWLGNYYTTAKNATNLDLYNWGLALYAGEKFGEADSVFAMYENKYPDQIFGYLWRARCNALIDTTMEKGLAIPHYTQLIEVAIKDSVTNKPHLIKAYGYIGAYEANVEKDYQTSLSYFNKILALDKNNSEAAKYTGILQKWIEEGKGKSDEGEPGENKPDNSTESAN